MHTDKDFTQWCFQAYMFCILFQTLVDCIWCFSFHHFTRFTVRRYTWEKKTLFQCWRRMCGIHSVVFISLYRSKSYRQSIQHAVKITHEIHHYFIYNNRALCIKLNMILLLRDHKRLIAVSCIYLLIILMFSERFWKIKWLM